MIELLRRVKHGFKVILRETSQVYFSVKDSSLECNLCKLKTNSFESDLWHKNSICPRCKSQVRHRLLWAAITELPEYSIQRILRNKGILHFAPEPVLRARLQKFSDRYKTADLFAEGYKYERIDYTIDMSQMLQIQNDSFDCFIALDVLEHIRDHKKAIEEIYRVLRPGGVCVLTVPQKDNLETTEEDLSLSDPTAREKRFGQFDHWRIYGRDFPSMLQSAGFQVSMVTEKDFDPHSVRRNVLFPPILSSNPLATNYRIIYFGAKAKP
jgi:SAM-dependent methyltransferase